MHYKVVIVGAGMAGLGASHVLHDNEMDNILVVEARGDAGGRVETIPVGESFIDLGAQWVHGVDTRLHQLAVRHDLVHEKTSDEGGGLFVRDDGKIIDDWLVRFVNFRIGRILEECENFVDAEEYPESVGHFLETKFRAFVEEECHENDAEVLWELYDWNVRFQLIDNSCDNLNQLSAREWGRYSCLGKDGQAHINLKGGYGALIDVLVHELPKKIFLFNTEITTITFKNDYLQLLCANGDVITSDHVIITSSIGALKELKSFLNFRLPSPIDEAIKNLGFGGMGKVFLLFEKRWWRSDGFQLIWRRTRPDDGIVLWTKHFSGFETVLDQPNMLLGWLSGLGVDEMEKLDDEVVGKQCAQLLRTFLKDERVPCPIKVYKSSWRSCKWIRGGYSHTTPSCDRLGVGATTLATPVSMDGIPRVLFAGEAAHATHFSTTHGAYESGEQQAQFLVDYLKKNASKVQGEN